MRQTFDGAAFGRMICSAAASIELKKQKINELNVFPVPDGDTGTNMSMTLGAAATELRRKPDVTLTKAADVAASAPPAPCCAVRAATPASSSRCCSAAFPRRSRAWSRPTAAILPPR